MKSVPATAGRVGGFDHSRATKDFRAPKSGQDARAPRSGSRSLLAVLVASAASAAVFAAGASHAQSPAGPHAPAPAPALRASLTGNIALAAGGQPVAGARITLFRFDLSYFREARSSSNGNYSFSSVLAGAYRLGVASAGRAYQEALVTLVLGTNQMSFALAPEADLGHWDVIGNTLPEFFDATDMAALRPDGTIMYCHSTIDPILFDPVTGSKLIGPSSGSAQGCMNTTLLSDGSVLIVGGQNGTDPGSFTNAIPWVKRFRPNDTWIQLANLNLAVGRWYPGLARLNDGRVIAIGGGTAPSAQRTPTCEVFDLSTLTWSYTGSTGTPMEFPPVGLLYTGKVLHSWGGQPQLYDPATGVWTNTGQLVFPSRGYPGHSDHSLLVLTDGRALALGVSRVLQPGAAMAEYYDPASAQWSAGTSPSLVRYQAEIVYLPDGHVFAGGGDKGSSAGPEPNVLGCVKRCDLFEPISGAWRRVADALEFREYHAVTLLVPDGRVVTTGGTEIKFQYGPTSANIEAYSPPYLFRGVRPAIANLSDSTPRRGQTLSFSVFPSTKLTKIVLMGAMSTTHWVDGGIPRRLELVPVQSGNSAQVVLPGLPDVLPLGWYMLFGMVDDIPSKALFLRVDP